MRKGIVFIMAAAIAAGAGFLGKSAVAGPKGLTKAELVQAEWGPDFAGHGGLYISFNKDGTYDKEWRGEGRLECSGKFKFRGARQLLLTRTVNPEHSVEPGFGCPRLVCKLKTTGKNLFYSRYLDCGTQKFWDPASAVRAGSIRKIGKVKARTMGSEKIGRVTWPMKYRTAPTKRAKTVVCNDSSREDGKPVSVIPRERRLYFLARTLRRERIGKYRAYWYYVMPVDEESFSCSPERGWIYGAFIKWEK